jgi:hypothetical protein
MFSSLLSFDSQGRKIHFAVSRSQTHNQPILKQQVCKRCFLGSEKAGRHPPSLICFLLYTRRDTLNKSSPPYPLPKVIRSASPRINSCLALSGSAICNNGNRTVFFGQCGKCKFSTCRKNSLRFKRDFHLFQIGMTAKHGR